MRRAGRIIYNGAVAVSLLLCLGTVGVWVRSYWVRDFARWDEDPAGKSFGDLYALESSWGGLQVATAHWEGMRFCPWQNAHFHYYYGRAGAYPWKQDYRDAEESLVLRSCAALGFEVVLEAKRTVTRDPSTYTRLRTLTFPLYFPTLLFTLLPAHYFLRVRRRRRIANRRTQGCCIFCGYDLRSSPARCPECGREPSLTGQPKPQTQAPAPPRQ